MSESDSPSASKLHWRERLEGVDASLTPLGRVPLERLGFLIVVSMLVAFVGCMPTLARRFWPGGAGHCALGHLLWLAALLLDVAATASVRRTLEGGGQPRPAIRLDVLACLAALLALGLMVQGLLPANTDAGRRALALSLAVGGWLLAWLLWRCRYRARLPAALRGLPTAALDLARVFSADPPERTTLVRVAGIPRRGPRVDPPERAPCAGMLLLGLLVPMAGLAAAEGVLALWVTIGIERLGESHRSTLAAWGLPTPRFTGHDLARALVGVGVLTLAYALPSEGDAANAQRLLGVTWCAVILGLLMLDLSLRDRGRAR